MIRNRLQTFSEAETPDAHPDEDTICAFVEGRLEEATSTTMVSHLIVCGLCRRTTAQFSRGDFPSDTESDALRDEGPGRVSSLLSLASRLIPSSEEDTVFAYQNPPELNTEANESDLGETDSKKSSSETSSSAKQKEPE